MKHVRNFIIFSHRVHKIETYMQSGASDDPPSYIYLSDSKAVYTKFAGRILFSSYCGNICLVLPRTNF
jgi:hypothetical protein